MKEVNSILLLVCAVAIPVFGTDPQRVIDTKLNYISDAFNTKRNLVSNVYNTERDFIVNAYNTKRNLVSNIVKTKNNLISDVYHKKVNALSSVLHPRPQPKAPHPKQVWKVHKYSGIELKPVPALSLNHGYTSSHKESYEAAPKAVSFQAPVQAPSDTYGPPTKPSDSYGPPAAPSDSYGPPSKTENVDANAALETLSNLGGALPDDGLSGPTNKLLSLYNSARNGIARVAQYPVKKIQSIHAAKTQAIRSGVEAVSNIASNKIGTPTLINESVVYKDIPIRNFKQSLLSRVPFVGTKSSALTSTSPYISGFGKVPATPNLPRINIPGKFKLLSSNKAGYLSIKTPSHQAPASSYGPPSVSTSYGVPSVSTSYGVPSSSYGAPQSSYSSASSSSFSNPSSSFGGSSSTYQAPSSSSYYTAPSSSFSGSGSSSSYVAPSTSYTAPSSSSYSGASSYNTAPSSSFSGSGASSSYVAPSTSYSVPSTSYNSGSYVAPSSSASAGASSSYSSPASNFNSGTFNTGAYVAPSVSYNTGAYVAPSTSYGTPSSSAYTGAIVSTFDAPPAPATSFEAPLYYQTPSQSFNTYSSSQQDYVPQTADYSQSSLGNVINVPSSASSGPQYYSFPSHSDYLTHAKYNSYAPDAYFAGSEQVEEYQPADPSREASNTGNEEASADASEKIENVQKPEQKTEGTESSSSELKSDIQNEPVTENKYAVELLKSNAQTTESTSTPVSDVKSSGIEDNVSTTEVSPRKSHFRPRPSFLRKEITTEETVSKADEQVRSQTGGKKDN